jgi:hypothetical protein
VQWDPWTGASEIQESSGLVQELIRFEDLDTTGNTKYFWRVDFVSGE